MSLGPPTIEEAYQEADAHVRRALIAERLARTAARGDKSALYDLAWCVGEIERLTIAKCYREASWPKWYALVIGFFLGFALGKVPV
jgi:hypothetical protein